MAETPQGAEIQDFSTAYEGTERCGLGLGVKMSVLEFEGLGHIAFIAD